MRVGLIGAGLQASRIGPVIADSEKSELVCITDTRISVAQKLAKNLKCDVAKDWKEVLNSNIDSVVICVPPKFHAELSIEAMKKGIHVLCEKPISYSLEDAQIMISTSKETNTILQIGFNHRYHPGILQIMEWYRQGEIGEINFIRSIYGIGARQDIKNEWRSDPNVIGGGQLMEQGIHCIDLMRWFVGNPTEVVCFTSNPSSIIEPMEDNAFVIFKTKKNQLINIHSSLLQWKNYFSFEVFGKEGYAIVNGLGGSYGTEKAVLGKRDPVAPFSEKIIEYRGADQSWKMQWTDFENSILDKSKPSITGIDGYESLRLVFAAYESYKQGIIVKLDNTQF